MAIESTTTLLDRERELEELESRLALVSQGQGQIVLVEAVAGLGKTSLLRAGGDLAAAAGFTCLRARATELERDFAYGCVRQLFEPPLMRASDEEKASRFHGAAGLSQPLFATPGSSPPPPTGDTSMLHGLYWLADSYADERPLALVIDDLHWADTESLRFLNFVAPRMDGCPVAVIASARPEETNSDELPRLAAAPETTTLRLTPLSAEATAKVCRRRLGTDPAPEFAQACREATGGNPFFLEALLREASERGLAPDATGAAGVRSIGPSEVAEAVRLRLRSRPPEATALVRAVAVLGDGASLQEAAALAEIEEPEAARAADLLAALATLKPTEPLEFAHPIIRRAISDDMGARERAAAHERAAAILAAQGASEERIAAQIAETEPAGDLERVELLRRVADAALKRGAPAAAAAWLARALAEPPAPEDRAELLLELGSAELRLGRPEAVTHLRSGRAGINDPHLIARHARQLANAHSMLGQPEQALEALETAVGAVEADNRELALLLEAELAAKAQQSGLEARARAGDRLNKLGSLWGATPGERQVIASLAFEQARASDTAAEAAAHLERGLAGGRLLGEQELDVAGPFYALIVGLLATDALDIARISLEQALAHAEARGALPALGYVLAHRGWVALRRGDVGQAEADARSALDLLEGRDIQLGRRFALALLVEALIETGQAEEADRALMSSGLGEEIPPGLANNDLLHARGLLRLATDRPKEGLDDLREFGRRDELHGAANPLASRWRSHAALGLAALGEDEEARALAAEDLERARRWEAASGEAVALHARALADGGEIELLREACERAAESPGPARTRARAHRPRRRAAPRQQPHRGENLPGRGPRPSPSSAGQPRWPSVPRPSSSRRAVAPATHRHRRAAAHRLGAPRGRAGRQGREQSADRPGAVRHTQDRGDPPRPRVPQARHRRSQRARASAPRSVGDQGPRSGTSPTSAPRRSRSFALTPRSRRRTQCEILS